jgi:probable addiction module antidote protein
LKDLADPREAAGYVNAALEDSEEMFLIALRDVAEARQMSKVAIGAGISRESIYRMLSKTGNPTQSSLRGILKALNLKLSVEAVVTSKLPSVRSGHLRKRPAAPTPNELNQK